MPLKPNRRIRKSSTNLPAFTLIELLVVITIIIALLALLGPSMKHAWIAASRARESADTRQMTLAALSFATENFGELPLGTDDNQGAMFNCAARDWLKLVETDGLGLPLESEGAARFGCFSWWDKGTFFSKNNNGKWIMPWVYWGNRPDETRYSFIERITNAQEGTSDTLFTCLHRRSSSAWASQVPHIVKYGEESQWYAPGTPWEKFDFLCVGLVDGAVVWQDAPEFKFFDDDGGSSRFFYLPRTPKSGW